MKKFAAIVLVLALLLVGGCATKKASNGKVSFILGLPGGDGVTPMELVDNFKAATADKYDITTDVSGWNDFVQKVKMQIVAKNEITTVFVTDSLTAPSFGAQGILEDLSDRVKKDIDTSAYTSAFYALSDEEGHLWGVPHAINPIAILYNKDIFDAKKVPYPTENWTWQDMMDMAQNLTLDENSDGETDVYGISYSTNITQGWLPFMAAVGASPYKDGFRNSNLDDPKVLDAYEKYQAPLTNGYAPHSAEIATYKNPAMMFAAGKLAMYIAQSSDMTVINNNAADLNYDAQIMPIGWNGVRSCIYVPNVWVVCSSASDVQKDAAWEWLRYWLSEEAQMTVADKGLSGYPIMKKALDTVTDNGQKPAGKDAFYRGIDEHGITILENPCSLQVEAIVSKLTCNVRDAVAPIPELISEAHADMQDELDNYYNNL